MFPRYAIDLDEATRRTAQPVDTCLAGRISARIRHRQVVRDRSNASPRRVLWLECPA